MRRVAPAVIILAILTIAGHSQRQALAQEQALAPSLQKMIDEVWLDTNSKPKGSCQRFVVKAGPPRVLRGKTSGRDCLGHAITAYRAGDHEKAFGWILAGQCLNREARTSLVLKAPRVMQYVVNKYGPQVP